jgi:hypothetical protein
MDGPPTTADRLSAEGHKPWQFTVRLFFGLAVLVSLFAAAAWLEEDVVRVFAIEGLIWCVLAWLYLRFRALPPLLVLLVGTPVAALLANPFAVFWSARALVATTAWSMLVSLVVATGWCAEAWWWRRASRRPAPTIAPPSASREGLRLGVILAIVHTIVLLGDLAVQHLLGPQRLLGVPEPVGIVTVLLDAPLLLVIALCQHGGASSAPWVTVIALAVNGAILYFGIGWLAGYAAGLIRPSFHVPPDLADDREAPLGEASKPGGTP